MGLPWRIFKFAERDSAKLNPRTSNQKTGCFWVPKQEAPTGLGLAEASRFWKGRLVMATSSKLMIAPLAKEETRRDNAVGKDYQ
jgi:hypothetical protein